MVLSLRNISFHYPGTKTGIHDISLEIARGELLAVIGASGSGKTTILNLIAGFMTPQMGEILIDGKTVSQHEPERRNLGVVFQSYALFPHMRLWENVAYPLKIRGVERERRRQAAFEMLERVGMGARPDAYPAALSGGQQQRVALARALVFKPLGLLLDEPLSALDAGLRVEMRDEILAVQREANIATLLVTHDQEEALSIADKVALMRDGRLIQIGTPRQLYEQPVSVEVAAFVGQSNLWPGKIVAMGQVETPLGLLSCDNKNYAIGARVTVLVRPERVEPHKHKSDEEGCFSGTIIADRFLGSLRRIDMIINGATVKMETHIRDAIHHVRIAREAVHLLPEQERGQ